ncbi:MAG TPA: rhomboid family intramembrane serine protease [Flavipsychrobacter sp.]|nr:rhomboid family intramembrane serine protease [Flavipsychrobacter sp.]
MYVTIALIVLTVVISSIGFKDELFVDKYAFKIRSIQDDREYQRLVTSGFLHIGWLHLLVNMFVLFSFGSGIEAAVGIFPMLLIYFSSLLGGNLLAWVIHKHQSNYSSVGASGAISGLVFATIALYPQLKIFFIPGWVFGLVYVIYTLYAIRSQRRDVGHAAHLGGGLVGMAFALLLFPQTLVHNWLPVLCIFVPALALLLVMIYKPELILINKGDVERSFTLEDKYNISKKTSQSEIDRILEKINERGIKSLSKKEREVLEHYSKS